MEWIVGVLVFGSGAVAALLVARPLARRPWLRVRAGFAAPRWRIPCRDGDGRSDEVLVTVQHRRIVLHAPDGRPITFAPLQVGALRAALREAATSPAAADGAGGSHRLTTPRR